MGKYTTRKCSECLVKIMDSISEDEMEQSTNRMLRAIKLKEILDEKNLFINDAASILNVDETQIEEWLAGNEDIPVDIFERLI